MVTIEEYRKILGDRTTPDELVRKKIEYLEAFCRNIARNELEGYIKNTKEGKDL